MATYTYIPRTAGTITAIQANGTPVAVSGVANIPAASASVYGVTQLSTAVDSTSTTVAATPSAVKQAYDLAASKTANIGTITAVQANGTDVATSGTANIPAASTSAYGVTKLSSATNSSSEVLAATASAVKQAYDLAASKTSNTGTITKVQANGTDVASSGTANIPAASTSAYGVTKLSNSTSSTSTALAATANAVKTAYDLAASKLDSLDGAVLTSGAQSASGTKTWGGAQIIKNSATSPSIAFRGTNQDSTSGAIFYTGTQSSSKDYAEGRFSFYQYRPNSSGTEIQTGTSGSSLYERYQLPQVDVTPASNKTYQIITEKGPAIFQTVTYSHKYTSLAAGSYVGITGTNFDVSTPTGYTPIGALSYTTASTSVNVVTVNAGATGSATVMGIRNNGSSAVTQTASITILYVLSTLI